MPTPRSIPDLSRSAFLRIRADLLLLVGWTLAIAHLEILGRAVPGRIVEFGGVMVLGAATVTTWMLHRARPFALLTWLRSRTTGMLAALVRPLQTYYRGLGVDFRDDPPYPSGAPRPLLWIAGVSAAVILASMVLSDGGHVFPPIRGVTFVGYLLVLALVWTIAISVGFFHLSIFVFAIHDVFVRRHTLPEPRALSTEIVAVLVILAGLATVGVVLPTWCAFLAITIIATVAVTLLILPSTPTFACISHRAGPIEHVARIGYRLQASSETMCVSLASAAIATITVGEGMAATNAVGSVFVWLASAGVLTYAWLAVRWCLIGRRFDPTTPNPRKLHVHGAANDAMRNYVLGPLRARSWDVTFDPREPGPEPVVEVRLTKSMDRATQGWPLPVSVLDLENPDTLDRLVRRDIVLRRRTIRRAFAALFKHAALREFENGTGFLLGPQHWFLAGMFRDAEEDETDLRNSAVLEPTIGPPFHLVFPHRARHHYATVMRALELDIAFVEDGVGFRGWRRVLTVLFEIYDVHGGKKPAEDRHFIGLTGLRVMIHDLAPDRPFSATDYPEPEYSEVGRGRILHVFKDRGEEEEIELPQFDLDSLPVPMLV